MRFLRLNLSPRTQRRLARYWSRISWYVGYPVYHVRNFFWAIGVMLAEWWRRRIIRYLIQGLPALLMTIGAILFGALVFGQDRNLLATEYQRQGYASLLEGRKRLGAGEDATAPLAKAEMCFQRLMTLQDKYENRYLLALVLDVRKQPGVVLELLKGMAPPDKVGYGQAHLHMAELYMTGRLAPPPGSSPGRAAENHLIRARMTRNSAPRAN